MGNINSLSENHVLADIQLWLRLPF